MAPHILLLGNPHIFDKSELTLLLLSNSGATKPLSATVTTVYTVLDSRTSIGNGASGHAA